MKTTLSLLICLLVLFSCNNKSSEKKLNTTTETHKELSTPEKIAEAYGIDSWNDVTEIQFTFNVDKGDYHMARNWTWKPKKDEIYFSDSKDSIHYSRSEIDSLTLKIDAKFINDKYWLLAPFNLVWDQNNYTYSEKNNVIAPISKDTLQQLTLVYKNEGGYTPGDAYDFYFTEDFLIKEWTYRDSNRQEPSLISTWENQETLKGIRITKDFISQDGLRISFSNIQIH